ncbi:hypothetical protein [Microbacterium elymi]|uniref:hypothetical protein n=1 Tax=Microbacterium elymi TaxID=2909587 RepID=UPI00338E14A2
MLDQLVGPTDPDLAMASRELAHALVQAAPAGCDVGAIVPSGPFDMAGLAEVRRLGMARRELAAAWQLGVTAGVGGGLIHSPTLLAPLSRHDRVNDHDQTVVTLWDLLAWEHPDELTRPAQTWSKAMPAARAQARRCGRRAHACDGRAAGRHRRPGRTHPGDHGCRAHGVHAAHRCGRPAAHPRRPGGRDRARG